MGYQQRRPYRPQGDRPTEPTFIIKTSDKTQQPFAKINGAVGDRQYATLTLFPSKFPNSFAGLSITGRNFGMVAIDKGDKVDVDGDTLKIDLGWLQVTAKGKNTEELVEFLGYIANMPKEAPQPRQQYQAPPRRNWGQPTSAPQEALAPEEQPQPPAPKRAWSWKK